MQKTLLHPFGLALVIVSLVLAGLMLFVLDRWSGQALWIVLLGLLAYAASVAVLRRRTVGRNSIENEDSDGDFPEYEDPEPNAPEDETPEEPTQDAWRLFQRAFQQLNNPTFLAQCELVSLLPKTLTSAAHRFKGHGIPDELTHLEKAQILRQVLVTAIEQLKPAGGSTGAHVPETLHYDILHERYVQGRPVAYILIRFSISEANYHVRRRAAIDAVARQLLSREELI